MEHSQANIDALRSYHEEADPRMSAHVSHAMELYSPGRVVIFVIVKLTLMPSGPTMKKQIRECLPMFHLSWNNVHQVELLYGT